MFNMCDFNQPADINMKNTPVYATDLLSLKVYYKG